MDKVYVLRGCVSYEGSDVIGVYSNEEAADAAFDYCEKTKYGNYDYFVVNEESYQHIFVPTELD